MIIVMNHNPVARRFERRRRDPISCLPRDESPDHAHDGQADRRAGQHERSADAPSTTEPNEVVFTRYTDEEHGYSVAHPTEWTVEPDTAGGVSFDALVSSNAGAVVFVDEPVESVSAYVEEFATDFRLDTHVHASEPITRETVRLKSGHRGERIECSYVGTTPTETMQFSYLLAVVGETGYTLGVDWNDEDSLGAIATRIIESFAVGDESVNTNTNTADGDSHPSERDQGASNDHV